MKGNSDRQLGGYRSRKTGQVGERLIRDMFEAWDWIPRQDVPDEGIDFNVEVPAGSGRPATRILVQVKTCRTMRGAPDGAWVISVDSQRLSEYQQHRQPVFIIAVELDSNSARWIDVSSVPSPTERQGSNQKTRIRVPRHHTLQQAAPDIAFEAAILVAMRQLDDKHYPPRLALECRRLALEKVDPRFTVSVDLVGGRERYSYAPKQPIDLTLQFNVGTTDERSALYDMWRFGVPATVTAQDVAIDGSVLFSKLPNRGQLSISGEERSVRLCLGYRGLADGCPQWIFDEQAKVYVGREGGMVSLKIDQCPVEIELRLLAASNKVSLKHIVDYTCWNGLDIRSLPYLTPIVDLMCGSIEAGVLAIGIRECGETQLALEVPLGPRIDTWRGLFTAFRSIAALARVCRELSVPFAWRDGSIEGQSEMETWLAAGKMLEGEGVGLNFQGFSTVVDGDTVRSLLDDSDSILVIRNSFELHAWGELVAEIPVLVRLTAYEFSFDGASGAFEVRRSEVSRARMFWDHAPDAAPPEAVWLEDR